MLMRSGDDAARLSYGPNSFRVVRSGQHVFCAVTGVAIPLEELRYWSVERQEPYVDAHAAARAMSEEG